MTNWKVVKSGALSEQYFPRFVVVDAESGKVLDDARRPISIFTSLT